MLYFFLYINIYINYLQGLHKVILQSVAKMYLSVYFCNLQKEILSIYKCILKIHLCVLFL